MGTNCEDWGRCNIGQKKLKMIVISFIVVVALSSSLLILIDCKLNPILMNYVDLEADKILNYVVNNSIQSLEYDASEFVLVKRNNKDEIERITYNTEEINRFKKIYTQMIDEKIREIENGIYYDDFFAFQKKQRQKFPNIKQGYLCEINYNSIRNSVLFGNVGPSIPVKLSFLGFLNVDVDIKTREYGINNVLVEVDVVVDTSSVVTMPVSSKKHHYVIHEPISVEIINGRIPNYYYEKLS